LFFKGKTSTESILLAVKAMASFLASQAVAAGMHYVVISGLKYDFKDQLAFYGTYHQDPVNQAIHFVFIPIILWTAMLLFAYHDIFGLKLSILGHRLSWATTLFLTYVVYYNILDPFGGRVYTFMLMLMYYSASYLVSSELEAKYGKSGSNSKPAGFNGIDIWKIALFLHAFSWYMQIHPGHAIYEGVKPALLDSMAQAFSVAPLFAFYEGIWFFGYQPDLQDLVVQSVNANRAALCDAGGNFPWC